MHFWVVLQTFDSIINFSVVVLLHLSSLISIQKEMSTPYIHISHIDAQVKLTAQDEALSLFPSTSL